MSKKQKQDKTVEAAKKKLGKMISKCRGETSQRTLAKSVGLPPSNMKYIEDGINAPTAETYTAIVQNLNPDKKMHDEMDRLYSVIRGAPPPDVCNIVLNQKGMNDTLRIIEGQELSDKQMEELQKLLTSFITESERGETKNG
ncbi:MAG: hypothetical protein IJZ16_14090 [Clostridia bacterium]|nr:hypothetical protein [Clostridia bacterium]